MGPAAVAFPQAECVLAITSLAGGASGHNGGGSLEVMNGLILTSRQADSMVGAKHAFDFLPARHALRASSGVIFSGHNTHGE